MADPELEAIRQKRMQELMAQHGVGNQQNSDQQKAQEDAKRFYQDFWFRAGLCALHTPDIAKMIPLHFTSGTVAVIEGLKQLKEVSEERLISLLEQINTQTTKQTKVTIQRRRSVLEDND